MRYIKAYRQTPSYPHIIKISTNLRTNPLNPLKLKGFRKFNLFVALRINFCGWRESLVCQGIAGRQFIRNPLRINKSPKTQAPKYGLGGSNAVGSLQFGCHVEGEVTGHHLQRMMAEEGLNYKGAYPLHHGSSGPKVA